MTEHFLTNRIGIRKLPEISYIIFTTPRSGSTFFCEALRNTRVAGAPGEHFLHWYRTECRPEQILPLEAPYRMVPPALQLRRALKRGTRNGVFGIKIMYSYYHFVEKGLRELTGFHDQSTRQVLESVFPNLHYIYLSRRNKIRQSVSLARAVVSEEWKKYRLSSLIDLFFRIQKPGKTKPKEMLYDFDKIMAFYKEMKLQDEEWEKYFRKSDIKPHRIFYEDFALNLRDSLMETLRYVGCKVDGTLKTSHSVLKKQSDVINDEWTERFQRDLNRLDTVLKKDRVL